MRTALFFILNGLGGAERVTIEISKFLLSIGWRVDFGIIHIDKYPDSHTGIYPFLPKSCEKHYVFSNNNVRIFKNLYKLIKAVNPNVVFSSAMHINQRLCIISPIFSKVKFIVRNDNYLYTLPFLKRLAMALTYRFADKIVAQTEEMQKELHGIGLNPNKIQTLHNPLNTEEIKLKSNIEMDLLGYQNKINFVAVGRFAPQKGFDVLIEAFAKVVERKASCYLHIIGKTDYESGVVYNQLKKRVEELGIGDKVDFVGFTPNPYPYMSKANVFVLSSRYEGLPNTLIEAQFLGIPCAATKCIPIISRIIHEGKNGFLAEPEDPNSLAEAMIKASSLGKVKMTYKPATREDFINLFDK